MIYPVTMICLAIAAAIAAATCVAAALARAGFPLPPGKARIGHVDGLRGYLALAVLAHHFIFWFGITRLGGQWTELSVPFFNELGAGSVALFFMITGLLFYPRVLAGFRATFWSTTYVTRVFRIVPLIAVSVAVIVAIIAARTGRHWYEASPAALAKWVLAIGEPDLLGYGDSWKMNANVLWSLRCEWLFYLCILPACALLMDAVRGRLPSWSVPMSLLCAAVTCRIVHPSLHIVQYVPLFAAGMLVYECGANAAFKRIAGRPAFGVAVGTALLAVMLVCPVPYEAALPVFALFFAAVVCTNACLRPLASRAALVLGECSYGIYILHGIALYLLFLWLQTSGTATSDASLLFLLPAVTVVVVLVSALACLAVERPFIRLGRWTAKRVLGAIERGCAGGERTARSASPAGAVLQR